MKRKLTLRTLLAAAMMMVGMNSAWAEGNKRTLDSNDYTSGTTDWTCPDGTSTYKNTGTSPRKYYAQCYESSGKGNRSCYKSVSYSSTVGTGYTTADLSTVGYNIEFDFLMRSGAAHNRAQSQFVVPTTGPNIATNNPYSGTDYIFSLSQPTRYKDAETNNGADIGYDTKWYINDLTNATDKTVTLDGAKWYHLKLVVTATSVDYTISEYAENGSSEMSVITNGTGSLSVASLPTVKGFWALLGRKASSNNGLLNFANFEMYDYSLLPQMTKTRSLNFKDIAGSVLNKTSNTSCTLTFDEKGADNHYAITTEGFNSDFAVSTNNTDKGWFLRYYGATKEANTGLWLYNSDGTMSVRNLPRGAWVTFNASAAVTASSNAVSSTDVASVSGSTYAFQVSDAGYATFAATKNSYVYSMDVYEPVNEVIGLLDKTTSYDTSIRGTVNKGLTILQGEQIMLNMNVRGNGANNWNGWSLRIANSDTSYDRALAGGNHINKEGSDAGIDNAYDGITQKWYYDGVDNYSSFMAAYKTQMMDANVDMTIEYGTDGLLTVTAESTMGGHNYKYEFVRTVAFSGAVTMKLGVDCAWLEILSTERTVSKSITTAGWATYCSPYALDLSGATGLTDAYIVTGGKKGVLTKTSVKGGTVPANTGLLLKGTEGSAVNVTIPVVASSETIVTGNILDGVTANTEIAAGSGWVLMDDATNGLGFYQNTNAFTVGANTAYIPVADLAVPGAGARAFYSLFDSETTGVGAALVKNGIVNNEIFNLQGQRVGQPTKGLYIVGGRKVVKK